VAAEKTECNRWPYTDLDEKRLLKFEVGDFVPAGGHRSRRLMSPDHNIQ